MLSTWKALGILGVLALAASLSATARAQESYPSDTYDTSVLETEVSELRAQFIALEERLEDAVDGGYEGKGGGGCCDSCCGCCDPCCRSEGYVFGAELAWLKPHHGNGVGVSSLGAPVEPDYETALRLWVGYQRCDGLGVRVRYWDYDHGYVAGAPAGAVAFHAWDTYVYDVEATDSSKLGCYWDMMFTAGFRYVDYWEAAGVVGATPGADNVAVKNITGIGATTSLELRRKISCTLGGFANARWSVIMGDENNLKATAGVVVLDRQLDDIKYMFEAQAGAEYVMPICNGGWYFARAGFEVQYWDGFGVDNQFGPVTTSSNASVGFGGFFFAAGLAR